MDQDAVAKGTRTLLGIDGRDILLSDEVDLVELMERIEIAARTEPTFVDLAVAGGFMSVLISSRSRVVVFVERGDTGGADAAVSSEDLRDWDL